MATGVIYYSSILISGIAIIIVVWISYTLSVRKEHFTIMETVKPFSLEEGIIRTFQQILHRDPSMEELKGIMNDMEKGGLNFYTLRQIIIDSDEYQRLIKVQSNTVSPELVKMIADRDQINRINMIYEQSLKRKMRSELALPYHDLYVHIFKNNDQLLRNLFLSDKYGTFEYEVIHTIALDRDKLFALYDRMYGLKEGTSPVWWPSVPLKEEIEKNKFVTYEGKEVWYSPLSSDEAPQSNNIIQPISIANTAGYWEIDDRELSTSMSYPWKGYEEEELTYTPYTSETTEDSSNKNPTVLSQPDNEPEPSLYSGEQTSSLGTSVLTIA